MNFFSVSIARGTSILQLFGKAVSQACTFCDDSSRWKSNEPMKGLTGFGQMESAVCGNAIRETASMKPTGAVSLAAPNCSGHIGEWHVVILVRSLAFPSSFANEVSVKSRSALVSAFLVGVRTDQDDRPLDVSQLR